MNFHKIHIVDRGNKLNKRSTDRDYFLGMMTKLIIHEEWYFELLY